jgi:uncharacterized protein (UPF0332 family)
VTSDQKKRDLALYRLKQAEESLDEAQFLFDGNKSPRSVINRAYYAMFYSILALLVFDTYSSSKHAGIISYFNRKFVKHGFISKELGKALNKAYDLRQRTDYRENILFTREQVEPFLAWSADFVDAVKKIMKDKGFI